MPPTTRSRRTTLGPVSTNRRVSLAGPSNAKSDTRKKRMSMAPRIAGGFNNNNDNEHPNKHSLTPGKVSSSTAGGRKSMGGAIHYGSDRDRDREHSYSRPSSIPPPTTMRVDSRPISDKTYFNSCVRNLYSYLETHGYEHAIKLKDLSRPSAKDFHNFMTFLMTKIDPTFNSGKRKFEDDVSLAFKALGYPFNISKTALVAAGSPHTWPTLLLAITWLIELLDCMADQDLFEDDFMNNGNGGNGNGQYDQDMFANIGAAGQPLPSRDDGVIMELEVRSKTAMQKYLECSYGVFLSGDDELCEDMAIQLLEYVEKDHKMIEQEIEKITDENGIIVESVTNIDKEVQDLPEHLKRLSELAIELEKFHKLVNQLKEHKASLSDKVQERTTELKHKETLLQHKELKIHDLNTKIQNQEYSIDDVNQLERERKRLVVSHEQILRKRVEYETIIVNKENELRKEMDRLERLVKTYNTAIEELNIDHNDDDYDMKVRICVDKGSTHEKDQRRLLGGVDLKNKVVPFLSNMKKELIDGNAQLRSDILQLMDKREENEEQVTENKDDIEILSETKRRTEETFLREQKEHETALSIRSKEIAELEEKVYNLRDPSAIEAVMSKYQSQINELSTMRKKHQEDNLARKQSVLIEFNQALRICSEYKAYREKELVSLQKYVSGKEEFDVELSQEEKKIVSSN